MNKRIYLSSPHMGGSEKKFIDEAFDTNWIAPLGKNVTEFENEVAAYVGVQSAAALVSGTSAIHLGLKALNVEAGDIVFCSSLTFSASVNPIIYQNAVPVFIDSNPETYNMSIEALEKAFIHYTKLGKRVKAVIVVHLYGQSCDMDEIIKICNKYETKIIEDAAESLGATYKNKHTGTLGDFGIYSFNGNKIITTSGGGMLVSNNTKAIEKARFWATQSRENKPYYEHEELGYNYRMSNVLAGIGRGQMKVLENRIDKKREIYEFYESAFSDNSQIRMQKIEKFGQSNYWLSTMTLGDKVEITPRDIISALEQRNIEARRIWKPMHKQPFYEKYKFFSHYEQDKSQVSASEKIFERGLCLPSDTKMTIKEQSEVIKIIKSVIES